MMRSQGLWRLFNTCFTSKCVAHLSALPKHKRIYTCNQCGPPPYVFIRSVQQINKDIRATVSKSVFLYCFISTAMAVMHVSLKHITLGERRLEMPSEIINHNYSITRHTVDSAASFFMWWCDITSEQQPPPVLEPGAVQPGRHKETGRSSDGHAIVIVGQPR